MSDTPREQILELIGAIRGDLGGIRRDMELMAHDLQGIENQTSEFLRVRLRDSAAVDDLWRRIERIEAYLNIDGAAPEA